MISIPEGIKPICLYKGAAATLGAAGVTAYISCKNAVKVWFLISHSGATDTDVTAIGLKEATSVAGGSAVAVTTTFPIWTQALATYTSSDTWTRATDAASYTPLDPATLGGTSLLFEWDTVKFSSGFDCIGVRAVAGDAANHIEVWAFIENRYAQATPPSAITD